MSELTHRSREVNGVRLHYVTMGEGEPVFLLHGWPQTWFAWRHVIPILAEKYCVIAPDVRGCGDSDKPLSGYDKKNVAADVRALAHALGYRSIFLVGHDMGAQAAYPYAAQWPEEVRAFAYVDGTLPGFGQEKQMDVSSGGSWAIGFNMAGTITEELVRGKERMLVEYWMRHSEIGMVDPTHADDEAMDRYAHAMLLPGGLHGSFGHWQAIWQDWEDNKQFGKTRLPMPVITVQGDHVFGVNAHATMQQLAVNVSSVTLKDCGHYVPEERPTELARELMTFFATLPPLGASGEY